MDKTSASLLAQGSDEWLEAKLGIFGGTTFKTVQSTGDGYQSLIFEKAAQRLTLQHQSNFSSQHTQWGIDHEHRARLRYEMLKGMSVEQHGLVFSPWSRWVAVSPDGLVDADGGIEIKCPSTTREHVRHVVNGPPPEYIAQIQGSLLVTGRLWWDFISFDPRLDENPDTIRDAMYVQRFKRDEDYIASLKVDLQRATQDVDDVLAKFIHNKGER